MVSAGDSGTGPQREPISVTDGQDTNVQLQTFPGLPSLLLEAGSISIRKLVPRDYTGVPTGA